MKDNNDLISTAFIMIVDEALKYLPEEEARYIFAGYDTLLTASRSHPGLDKQFIEHAMEATLHIAELGFQSEYVLSSLVYYPYLFNFISLDWILHKFGHNITNILQSLAILNKKFDYYLPWIKNISDLFVESKHDVKDFWKERTLDLSPNAFLAISKTPETAVTKLVDRLYFLRNINEYNLDSSLMEIIARDSIDIYAIVADFLGIWSIKGQIEDLSFKILDPLQYKAIASDLHERRAERQAKIDRATKTIENIIKNNRINAKVTGRPKHIYGLYKKKIETGKSIQDINDALGIRIIIDEDDEEKAEGLCFQALNLLFNTWPPAEGIYEKSKNFRDWITYPKENGYQSLHTTVYYENRLLEVQMRSQIMHDLAEYGVAAHWIYNRAGNPIALQEKYQKYVEQVSQFRRLYDERH